MPNANILFQSAAPANPVDAMQGALKNQAAFNDFKQQPLRNQLLQQTVDANKNKLTAEEAKFQLGDMAVDSLQIAPLLQAGDLPRAKAALEQRIAKVVARRGDPSHTQAMLDGLNNGSITPDQAVAELNGVVNAAQRYGILNPESGAQGMFAPMAAMDANGNPVFVQGSREGGLQAISGFRPYAPTVAEKTNAAVNEYAQKQDIKGRTEPAIAGASKAAEMGVESRMRPQIEADVARSSTISKQDAERQGGIVKAVGDEKEVGRILDLASPLLDKATQSLAGAGVDAAGRLVGVSNEGSRAAAQLKTLEGALIMKMPRMEGPQSNADQLLYRQMAAKIGDPTTPAEERKASVSMLRQLNARYTGQQNQSAPSADQIKGAQSTDPMEGKTAINPQTGQRIIRRNGQWVQF